MHVTDTNIKEQIFSVIFLDYLFMVKLYKFIFPGKSIEIYIFGKTLYK